MKSGQIPEGGQQKGVAKTQATFGSGFQGGFLMKAPAKPAKADPAKGKAELRPEPQPGAVASTAAAVAAAAVAAAAVASASGTEGPAPGAMPVPDAAPVAMPVAPVAMARVQVVEAEIGDTEDDQPHPDAAVGVCVRLRISKALLKALWAGLKKLKKFVPSHDLETAVRVMVGQGVREVAARQECPLDGLRLTFRTAFYNNNPDRMTATARTIDVIITARAQRLEFHALLTQMGGRLAVDFKVGGVTFGEVVELTRGDVREPSFAVIADIGNVDDEEECKDAIAAMAARRELGGVEFTHVGQADVNTFGSYVSFETGEETPDVPDLGWRLVKTGATARYEVMPPRFWKAAAQEQRFMLVRRPGEHGTSVNTWVKVRLVRLRQGQLLEPPPQWRARIIVEEEVHVAGAALTAAAQATAAQAAAAEAAAAEAAAAEAAAVQAAAQAMAAQAAAAQVAAGSAALAAAAASRAMAAQAAVAAGTVVEVVAVQAATAETLTETAPGSSRRRPRSVNGSPARELSKRPGRGGHDDHTDGRKAIRVPVEPEVSDVDVDPESQSSLGGLLEDMGLDEKQ